MLEQMGRKAREAARLLSQSSGAQRNQALQLIEEALHDQAAALLAANEQDLAQAQALSSAMQDRLRLNQERLQGIAQAVREIRDWPDPLHRVLHEDRRPNGMRLKQVSTPLGVVAVIFESRPNVTLDAAAMCLKSGNAVILRGGKEAIHTNIALSGLIRQACVQAGLPEDSVQLVRDTSRASAMALMKLRPYVDLLIPRGGKGLIRSALENATVPVLETGEGVCHVYVDKAADIGLAVDIVHNAKVNRPSTCNAAECLLVHRDIAREALPRIAEPLLQSGVELRADPKALKLIPGAVPASREDWGQEYNDLILAVKVVKDMDEALQHIARYGTRHSEAIVTADPEAAQRFLSSVDAAAVYHNVSTRFTDGGEFGFGAEIGISTQKLHCRGPVGIDNLTSTKYLVEGEGQLR